MKNYNQLTEIDKQEIINLFYEGLEFTSIKDKLEISKRSVARVLKEGNINTKRKNRYTLNESYFHCINTQEKAYILGLLYADGFVGNDKYNNIVISLTKGDRELLKRVAKEIEFTGLLRDEKKGGNFKNSKSKTVLNFSSKEMATDLRKLGLYPGKSTTLKEMPSIQKNLIRHFIRGYFDGDGTIALGVSTSYYKTKDEKIKVYKYAAPHFSLIGTKSFLKHIENYIPGNYSYRNSKSEDMKYMVCSARKDMFHIFKYMYDNATIYLERKFYKWNEVISAISK